MRLFRVSGQPGPHTRHTIATQNPETTYGHVFCVRITLISVMKEAVRCLSHFALKIVENVWTCFLCKQRAHVPEPHTRRTITAQWPKHIWTCLLCQGHSDNTFERSCGASVTHCPEKALKQVCTCFLCKQRTNTSIERSCEVYVTSAGLDRDARATHVNIHFVRGAHDY